MASAAHATRTLLCRPSDRGNSGEALTRRALEWEWESKSESEFMQQAGRMFCTPASLEHFPAQGGDLPALPARVAPAPGLAEEKNSLARNFFCQWGLNRRSVVSNSDWNLRINLK
jgi:hypothetical protein